jgi:predicted ATPase/class 3 adenylate cyclase
MTELPTGTVTFLFTDIEGSTNLARTLGDRWQGVLEQHHGILRMAIREAGGIVIRTEGDAFFAVLALAVDAIAACAEAQRRLAIYRWPDEGPVRVRMGMHTGEGRLGSDQEYVGLDVHRAARISAAGHGGQVLISEATRALVGDKLPDGVTLRDLGAHRLNDFDEPQHIHQLVIEELPSDFPAIRSLEIPSNLPVRLTTFVGRERERALVTELLDSSRLVTLTGPGGTGKTRLAVEAASGVLDRFPDGVFFVDLAPITDPALVPSAILTAVGPRGGAGPLSELERLQIELRDRETLLVLDNFEQVIEAASAVGVILVSAPRIRVLATSRSPLRLEGEREIPVAPLDLPGAGEPISPGDLHRFEAIALFAERATAIDPGFTIDQGNAAAIVEICRRLDGLPLAIELAASRLRVLSPAAMLERLDRALPLLSGGPRDRPDRQRTLRDAIDWSYRLLPPAVASLFRRLCVFAGGFTIAAAESICGPDGALEVGVLEGIEGLVDASLVRRAEAMGGADRFEMLQTIRGYGLEQLERGGEAAEVQRRHALHFLELAEASDPGLRGPGIERLMGTLHVEHDNLRAALTWALQADQGDAALRLVSALWRFWHLHGDIASGRRWVEQALALPSAAGRSRIRAKALLAAGSLAYWQLDEPALSAWYGDALSMFEELGDERGVAEARYDAAFGLAIRERLREVEAHGPRRRLEEAITMLRSSKALFEKLGDRRAVADSLFGLAVMYLLDGDLEMTRDTGEEALSIHREVGDLFGVSGSLYVVGRAATQLGDLDTGRACFLEALAIDEAFGERTGLALSLDGLADLEISEGHVVRAMRLAGASEAIKEGVGGQAPPDFITLLPRERARLLLSDEEIEAAWAEGRRMSMDEAIAYAREAPR